MNQLEQNQVALREDVNLIKNKLDQIMEVMLSLAKREDDIQQNIVIENVIPPQVNNLTPPPPIWIPVEDLTVREHPTFQDGNT